MDNSELVKRFGGHPLLQTNYDRIAVLSHAELNTLIPSLRIEGCARTFLEDLLGRLDRFTDGRKERFISALEATADMLPWRETLERIREHVEGRESR